MKRYLIGSLLIVALLCGLAPTSVTSLGDEASFNAVFLSGESTSRPDYRPGQILLKFQAEMLRAEAADVLGAHDLTILGKVGDLDVLEVAVPGGQEEALVETLTQDPRVEYAELDYAVHATIVPDDTYYSWQWGPNKIRAPEAWDEVGDTSDIIIAIVDTGVDLNHPDLDGKIVQGFSRSQRMGGHGWGIFFGPHQITPQDFGLNLEVKNDRNSIGFVPLNGSLDALSHVF